MKILKFEKTINMIIENFVAIYDDTVTRKEVEEFINDFEYSYNSKIIVISEEQYENIFRGFTIKEQINRTKKMVCQEIRNHIPKINGIHYRIPLDQNLYLNDLLTDIENSTNDTEIFTEDEE